MNKIFALYDIFVAPNRPVALALLLAVVLTLAGCGGSDSAAGSGSVADNCLDFGTETVNDPTPNSHSVSSTTGEACVIYNFTAPTSGTCTVTISPNTGDPNLLVASDAAFTEVLGQSQNTTGDDAVTFACTGSTVYHVLVSGSGNLGWSLFITLS